MCLLFEGIDQPGEKTSFAFHHRGAVTALSAPEPGIEQIPHGIAEHVEGVDDNRQGRTRPESQPWRQLHVFTPFPAEHTTPARNLQWQTESEEAQRGLGNDDPADVDGEDDDDGCHNIGQDMADQDLVRGGAHRLGCQKIVILFNTHHSASDDSGAVDTSGDPQEHDLL